MPPAPGDGSQGGEGAKGRRGPQHPRRVLSKVLGTQHPQHGEGCSVGQGARSTRSARGRCSGGRGHHGVTEPSARGGLSGVGTRSTPREAPAQLPMRHPRGDREFHRNFARGGETEARRHPGTRRAGRLAAGRSAKQKVKRGKKKKKKHPTDASATIPQPHGVVPPFPLWFWGKKIRIAFSGFFSLPGYLQAPGSRPRSCLAK